MNHETTDPKVAGAEALAAIDARIEEALSASEVNVTLAQLEHFEGELAKCDAIAEHHNESHLILQSTMRKVIEQLVATQVRVMALEQALAPQPRGGLN